jgi:hypothetical protein
MMARLDMNMKLTDLQGRTRGEAGEGVMMREQPAPPSLGQSYLLWKAVADNR